MEKSNKLKLKIMSIIALITPKYVFAATEDPIKIISNLTDVIYNIMFGVGGIILAISALQFGIAMKSHDPSAKDNAVLGFVGGALIIGARILIQKITEG